MAPFPAVVMAIGVAGGTIAIASIGRSRVGEIVGVSILLLGMVVSLVMIVLLSTGVLR